MLREFHNATLQVNLHLLKPKTRHILSITMKWYGVSLITDQLNVVKIEKKKKRDRKVE